MTPEIQAGVYLLVLFIGIFIGVRIMTPVAHEHKHTFGAWGETQTVESRTSFETVRAFVQHRTCLDVECALTEERTIGALHSGRS